MSEEVFGREELNRPIDSERLNNLFSNEQKHKKKMTKEELEKYTVDFMNNETNSNRSKLNSIMGKMLIRYAEIFQKRIADLEKENAELKAFKEKCKFNASDICKEIETENNLTKAKQLLKRCYENYIYLEPLRSEIEQFLNGECCPDCLCEDCTKDCEIKKLGLVEVENDKI